MSGHSKWATIKRQKGINDTKRGQAFTKLANAITISVKRGGGNTDPEFNASLRLAIDKAKAANMPKDNIERAINKGSGGAGGEELDEVLYEAFAPGGVGLLIEAVTDKKQRTVADVKTVLDKNGGTMAGQGAVSYQFQKAGEIMLSKNGKSTDDVLEVAMENDVSDYDEDTDGMILYTEPQDLQKAKNGLENSGFKIDDAGLIYKPTTMMSVEAEKEEKILHLIDKLEEMDDVQKVYTNLELKS
jgi:YebC/PmpR family DNA-binding regulatory protein